MERETPSPRELRVRDYMTPTPICVESGTSVAEAHRLMRAHHVRHLPVVQNGKLVGLVSQRDLLLMETLRDVDPQQATVAEAMSEHPYCVVPDALLHAVAQQMFHHKYGAAVVRRGEAVVGMFTTVDALKALAEVTS